MVLQFAFFSNESSILSAMTNVILGFRRVAGDGICFGEAESRWCKPFAHPKFAVRSSRGLCLRYCRAAGRSVAWRSRQKVGASACRQLGLRRSRSVCHRGVRHIIQGKWTISRNREPALPEARHISCNHGVKRLWLEDEIPQRSHVIARQHRC